MQTYCRIRGLQPWEGNKLGIRWEEKTVRNYGLSTTSTNYTFTDVFGPEKANEDTFQEIAKPMVEQVIEGFNSILLAYGQTGSGKVKLHFCWERCISNVDNSNILHQS